MCEMITNMVHVIDALARFGVLQFGQGGQFSADLSAALLHCEATVDRTRNWRLQADCLEKFSCLANCISPVTIQTRFIPLLFDRMKNTRTLPCKIAAARTHPPAVRGKQQSTRCAGGYVCPG